MQRRSFLGLLGLAMTPQTDRLETTDGDRHAIAATRKSRAFVERRLEDELGLDDFYHWRFQSDSYLLPQSADRARMQAEALNCLIDAPYQYQDYDCNGFSLQLLSMLLRSGMDAGLIGNGQHMWIVMVTADGTVIEWEPINNTEVGDGRMPDYRTDSGLLLF